MVPRLNSETDPNSEKEKQDFYKWLDLMDPCLFLWILCLLFWKWFSYLPLLSATNYSLSDRKGDNVPSLSLLAICMSVRKQRMISQTIIMKAK